MTKKLIAMLLFHLPPFLLLFQTALSFQSNLDSLFQIAVAHQRAGNYAQSKTAVRLLLDQRPDHHDARNLYARLLAWEGDFTQALVQYDSVLLLERTDREARYGKGLVFAWMKQYDKAQELFDALHAEDPSNPSYLLQQGNLFLWSQQPTLAYEKYEQAYRLDSSSVEIVRGLARSSARDRKYRRAVDWYRKVLSLSPGDPEARHEIVRFSYTARHELQLQWHREYIRYAASTQNTIGAMEYYYTIDESWKPYLHASVASKFGKSENRFGVGLYSAVKVGMGLFAQLLFSPGATVIPTFDGTFEIDQQIGTGIDALLTYRFLGFAAASVHVVSPGMTMYASDRIWLTPRLYFSTSSSTRSMSGVLTAFYTPSERATLRLGVTVGDESFRATTLREIVSTRSTGFFAGAKTRLHENLAFESFYQYTARQHDVRFHQLTAVISLLF